ncbi:hypothetical protein FHR32_005102 [Streptosporangium album]|uniref:Uncharacterized protein n=1 Tax=Streptosporangium album TaxID=47479 RepID=A0A7W7WBW5_9ACTN|nr:hypothetical protein [Streptosporangium album]MBB4940725.1 hypothetical protein [Streptosporangium album]
MFTGGVFTATWERIMRSAAPCPPASPPAEAPPPAPWAPAGTYLAASWPILDTDLAAEQMRELDVTEPTAFEDDAQAAVEAEAWVLDLLAVEVDALGASPLQAAQRLFGGPHV